MFRMKRGILIATALCLMLCACGQAPAKSGDSASWQEQYDLGMRYLNEGKYEEAILAFNTAIEIDPKQADAYVGLAKAYTAAGDSDGARKALEQGLEAADETDELQALYNQLDANVRDRIDISKNEELEKEQKHDAEESGKEDAVNDDQNDPIQLTRGISKAITVTGEVFENRSIPEYAAREQQYYEEYGSVQGDNGVYYPVVGIAGYGIRFTEPIILINEAGETITISEASITGSWEGNEGVHTLTGMIVFSPGGELRPSGNHPYVKYTYNPNGEYKFAVQQSAG